jgi:hypothetical protein
MGGGNGANETSARLMGLPVNRTKVLVYVFSGFCSAMAGILYSIYVMSGRGASGNRLRTDRHRGRSHRRHRLDRWRGLPHRSAGRSPDYLVDPELIQYNGDLSTMVGLDLHRRLDAGLHRHSGPGGRVELRGDRASPLRRDGIVPRSSPSGTNASQRATVRSLPSPSCVAAQRQRDPSGSVSCQHAVACTDPAMRPSRPRRCPTAAPSSCTSATAALPVWTSCTPSTLTVTSCPTSGWESQEVEYHDRPGQHVAQADIRLRLLHRQVLHDEPHALRSLLSILDDGD